MAVPFKLLAQGAFLAVIGYMLAQFIVSVANIGPEAIAGFFFIATALALAVHFGLKQWAFLQIDAPFLIGLGVGLLMALRVLA